MRALPIFVVQISLSLVLSLGSFENAILAEDLRFVTPLALRLERSPTSVTAGDLNGDGKLDLVASNGSGGIEVLRQDPASRTSWSRTSMAVGASPFMVRARDLDKDGFSELVVGDTVLGLWLIRNQKGELISPMDLPEARATRWVGFGDWNSDGHADLATANFGSDTVSLYSGDGAGSLRFLKNFNIVEPHAIEGFDFDGDGDTDLALGHGDKGLRVLEGKGDGSFLVRNFALGLEPCARYLYTGDLNRDGKGDVVLTCLRGTPQGVIANTLAGISLGDGSFEKSFDFITPDQGSIATAAIADLNGDGELDIAQVAANRQDLAVYPGKGDGTFLQPYHFGPTASNPVFLISADLDGDGLQDVVSADAATNLTVFWGRVDESFLTSARLAKPAALTVSAVADFDGNGAPDYAFSVAAAPSVEVYLNPGLGSSEKASSAIPVPAAYNRLAAADLTGDSTPDLLGINLSKRQVQRTVLDPGWAGEAHAAFPIEPTPTVFLTGRIDEDTAVDAALVSLSLNLIIVFKGDGKGGLIQLPPLSTVERPRQLVLGDADADGLQDLVVSASGLIAIHYGKGGAAFTEPVEALRVDPPRSFLDLALGDVTGDGRADLIVAAPGAVLRVLRGKGNRELEAPEDFKVPGNARSVVLVDLNGDGRLDIVTSNTGQTLTALFSRGDGGLDPPVLVEGAWPDGLDLHVLDATQDGVLDVIIFAVTAAFLFEGLPSEPVPVSRFQRGDADWTGKTDLTDAVTVLRRLFQGGELPCDDPGDADDDGRLALTDAVVILRWLFQGAPPPGAPGPEACGEDPTPDELAGCSRTCEGL